MNISIFTDELKNDDLAEALDTFRGWGLQWVDLRNRLFGKRLEALDAAELNRLRAMLDERGLKTACLESGLAKVHLPDADRRRRDAADLENLVRAADALDCRLVRSFFYWQPVKAAPEEAGTLHERADRMEQALAMFEPLARRARQAGLTLAFENCGVATWEVKAFIDKLGGPGLGMAWDVKNGWFSETEIIARDEAAYIRGNARLTRVVHVKGHGALPGTPDSIPYERVLAGLAAEGFGGAVSIETHNSKPEIDNVTFGRQILDHLRTCLPSGRVT